MNPVLYSDKSASQIALSAFATLLCCLNNLFISFGIRATGNDKMAHKKVAWPVWILATW